MWVYKVTKYKWTSFHSILPSKKKEKSTSKLLKINCNIENRITKIAATTTSFRKEATCLFLAEKNKKEKGKTSQLCCK